VKVTTMLWLAAGAVVANDRFSGQLYVSVQGYVAGSKPSWPTPSIPFGPCGKRPIIMKRRSRWTFQAAIFVPTAHATRTSPVKSSVLLRPNFEMSPVDKTFETRNFCSFW